MRRVCLFVALLLGLAIPASAQSPANCVVVNGVSQCANGIVFLTGASFATRAPDGSASATAYGFTGATNWGFYRTGSGVQLSINGNTLYQFGGNGLQLGSATILGWTPTSDGSGGAADTTLVRDTVATAACKSGTTACKWRFYQTTTGPVYNELNMTAPTISSGFGTSPSVVAGSTAFSMRINVGTGGAATSGVIGMPTAATGWNCTAQDRTTNIATRVSADSTSTVTVTAASAWTASDILILNCVGY